MKCLDNQYKKYLIFLFGSLAFSIGIQYIATAAGWPPFSGLAIAVAIFMLVPFIIRRRMRRTGGYGEGGGFFGQSQGVKYICLTCNNKYKGGSCPRCGSKMKRADF